MYEQLREKTNIHLPLYFWPKTLDEFIACLGKLGYPDRPVCFKPHVGKGSRGFRIIDPRINRMDLLLNYKPNSRYITLEEFTEILEAAAGTGGNILIPSFAVGRTQDLIYWLGRLYHDGKLRNQKVYIDSPMAIKVSEVYERHHHLFNEDDPHFRNFVQEGWDKWLPVLTYTESPQESMALNRISEGAVIIAGSGMCTGGRILHHLKHNLWRRKNHLVIVGFQAMGTLGRVLVDGADMVRIFGSEIAVKARVHTLGGFSATPARTS